MLRSDALFVQSHVCDGWQWAFSTFTQGDDGDRNQFTHLDIVANIIANMFSAKRVVNVALKPTSGSYLKLMEKKALHYASQCFPKAIKLLYNRFFAL